MVSLQGITAQAQTPIWPGLTLAYRFEGWHEPQLAQTAAILGQEDDLTLVHKPIGIPVHKTSRIVFQTLAHWVHDRLGKDFSPLNRIDQETSGIVAFARGADSFRRFSPEHGSVWSKIYLAVVRGHIPEASGTLDLPLGELPGDAIRSRMHVHSGGKPSLTLWRRLSLGENSSLLAVSPITGRKHQIRAHLAHLGFPLIGDKMYDFGGRFYLRRIESELDENDYLELGASHQLLHAFYLKLAPGGDMKKSLAETVMPKGMEAFDWLFPEAMQPYLNENALQAWVAGNGFDELITSLGTARKLWGEGHTKA
jgi:23S rRNA pseudouridine1911/1915/1917 synthase